MFCICVWYKISDVLFESVCLFEFMYGRQLFKGYEWGYGGWIIFLVYGWELWGIVLWIFVFLLVEKGYCVVVFDGFVYGYFDGKWINFFYFGGVVWAIIN